MAQVLSEHESWLAALEAQSNKLCHDMSGNPVVWYAYMVGVLSAQADKWIADGNCPEAQGRLQKARSYYQDMIQAAVTEGVAL